MSSAGEESPRASPSDEEMDDVAMEDAVSVEEVQEVVAAADEDDEEMVQAAVAVQPDQVEEVEEESEEEEVLAAVVVDDEDDDDDDDDGAVAAVAMAAEPVAVPVAEPVKPKPARKRPAKKRRDSRSKSTNWARISSDRLDEAAKARDLLADTVDRVPVNLSETHVVRSFGQLCLESPVETALFSTANALYPVGFSCDRFEFSPVHGRLLKLRCSILHGAKLQEQQRAMGVSPSIELGSGPVFRVMWGRGVDVDTAVSYPYDVYAASAPVSPESVDAVALPTVPSRAPRPVLPEEGMRVKVRFDKDQFYHGSIVYVGPEDAAAKSKKRKQQQQQVDITIQYDDGSTEAAVYPDPDISLLLPGSEEDLDKDGNVLFTKLNDKPVTSVVGTSALDVWAKVLLKLGLVDEIMVDAAWESLQASRAEGMAEAKGKIAAQKLQRQQARARTRQLPEDAASPTEGETQEEQPNDETLEQKEREAPSEREAELRSRVEALRAELKQVREENSAAIVALADARIREIGPFLCNPFTQDEQSLSHQTSWLATAVRKEKSKMGSTGNKKKVVTATDLLERNDTFFNGDIEALIEGLPGSEYCTPYVFHAFRAGGASSISRAWVHEAHLRQEREREKRLKISKEAKAKASQQREREMKRKKREDEREERKRQRMEEEDQKKKARLNERLSRLNVQVDERLFKEACFQREKVVVLLAKSLAKEFTRRRKAAELVSSQAAIESKHQPRKVTHSILEFPSLSKTYDEDVVQVWDFVATFGSFFLERGFVSELPSLDLLQTAINSLRGDRSSKENMPKAKAISALTDLAIALCKPLAAGLTRLLFASLIALYPALQKDFGAAFFNEVNSATVKDKEGEKSEKASQMEALIPVGPMTWQEIARLSLQSDALGELGLNRQESGHLLRGYRSAGHPNSKEARRLRRVEDFSVALLRQELSQGSTQPDKDDNDSSSFVVRVVAPCLPSCYPSDWTFYLHNVKSLPNTDLAAIRSNVRLALDILKSNQEEQDQKSISDLERNLELLTKYSPSDLVLIKKSKTSLLQILDRFTDEKFSTKFVGGVVYRDMNTVIGKATPDKEDRQPRLRRLNLGLLKSLELSTEEFKKLSHARENYMAAALKLKEEMDRQRRKEEGEDLDDDDDDDDDDEDNEQEKESVENGEKRSGDEPKPTSAEVVGTSSPNDAQQIREKEKTGPDGAASPQVKSADDGNIPLPGDAQNGATTSPSEPSKIGKPTPHDDFCGDIPKAHELIRRCLAVLRTLCMTGPAEPFLYPVDPQTNPGYYDVIVRPMCFQEVGNRLRHAAEESSGQEDERYVESVVAQFGRNVRLIAQNGLSYANAGPTIISAAGEMLRIFERLFLDWVLSPEGVLPDLHHLDADKCVDHHATDSSEGTTVIVCDGCEGNYNIARLDPPLFEVPKGDWYCPRCISGRWWGDLDPRIGKTVGSFREGDNKKARGRITRCFFRFPEGEDSRPSLAYQVKLDDGHLETWRLEDIDAALKSSGQFVPPIRCLEAVAESPGYGSGVDNGLRQDLVPVPMNPNISDGAGQTALSSSAFRDTIAASSTLLLIDPEEMTASEWLRLLVLLCMKCSSSDIMQNVASKLENEAAARVAEEIEKTKIVVSVADVLPPVAQDDEEEPRKSVLAPETAASNEPSDPAAAQPVNDGGESSAMVVDASAVEVVEEMEIESAPVADGIVAAGVEGQTTGSEEDAVPSRSKAIGEKDKRLKAREDGFTAFCIKNQLRPAVASFEEDTLTTVVESTLATKDPGLSFTSSRCRGMVCDFCGLSDIVLGTPLIRFPDDNEWNDLIPHASRSRRTVLVADMRMDADTHSKPPASSWRTKPSRLVAVTIRIGDELVSVRDSSNFFESCPDGGMLEFVPRNAQGFQDELCFRESHSLPFVTGSLSAHDCCAVAAHNARKEKVVQSFKKRQVELIEQAAGMTCGRTLELGRDSRGRSYWKFHSDSSSLFVCANSTADDTPGWHRFSEPECIASVILCLGKDDVVVDLKRAFPEATRMIKNKTWSSCLLRRHFSAVRGESRTAAEAREDHRSEEDDSDELYEEGEKVLVESKCGSLLWDATVIGVAKSPQNEKVVGYRVHYHKWSTRFDEWVETHRVVEPSDNNRQVQADMLEDVAQTRDGLPVDLDNMSAKEFLHARDRSRGSVPLPDFAQIARVPNGASAEEKSLAVLKAAVLLIEAAMPIGSVDTTDSGSWKPAFAAQWRRKVTFSRGPADLTRCTILLEDVIAEDWVKPQMGHLRGCLPSRWKAIGEASASSLAIRVFMLDRSILYGTVDKKRYKQKKR